MALQKVFKPDYIQHLRNDINIEDYLGDRFPFDDSQVRYLSLIRAPENLMSCLDSSTGGDLKTAIAIYEAYSQLTPIFAQKDDLWIYLTHVDLFQYVKERWPIGPVMDTGDEVKIKNHIINHWHHISRIF